MQHVLFIEQAKRLNIEQDCLSITDEEDQTNSIHIHDVLALVIESIYTQISTPALLLCVENGVPVIYCNEQHQPSFYCMDIYRHSMLLARLQTQIQWTDKRKQQAWLIILKQKLLNQIALLHSNHKDPNSISQIDQYCQQLDQGSPSADQINTAESISARIYFKQLFGSTFKRFEADCINHALNYGYAIIRAIIMNALCIKGLHPSLGIWHHSVRNRFNLADDLIEPLRPWVDKRIIEINPQQELSKENRRAILALMYKQVVYQGNVCTLKHAISLYTDDLYNFMSNECDTIHPIDLAWDL